MIRLAEYPINAIAGTVATQLAKVIELEENFKKLLAPKLKLVGIDMPAKDLFRLGQEISRADLGKIPFYRWKEIEEHAIRPQLGLLIGAVEEELTNELTLLWTPWKADYLIQLENLMALIRNHCARLSQMTSDEVSSRLNPLLPEDIQKETLSRKAISVLANTDGVSCVLNGMREPSYVIDTMGVMDLEPFPISEKIYRAFL